MMAAGRRARSWMWIPDGLWPPATPRPPSLLLLPLAVKANSARLLYDSGFLAGAPSFSSTTAAQEIAAWIQAWKTWRRSTDLPSGFDLHLRFTFLSFGFLYEARADVLSVSI